MDVKVRIRGVDQHVRNMAKASDATHKGAIRGVVKAAEYLLQKVKAKFGNYQPTGGSGGGPWAKLKYETIAKKLRTWGVGNKPLIASGKMKESFTVVKGGKSTISASVGSNDPKLIHHVYGAPRAGVPMRDPIRVTAVEERDACHDIIIKEIENAVKKV